MTTAEFIASLVASGITAGGINSVANFLLAKRREARADQLAEDTQVFNRLMLHNSKLEARVEVCEKGLEHCKTDHLECEKRHAFLEGRMEEMSKLVQNNANKIAEVTSDSTMMRSIPAPSTDKMVGIAVMPGKHDPSVLE